MRPAIQLWLARIVVLVATLVMGNVHYSYAGAAVPSQTAVSANGMTAETGQMHTGSHDHLAGNVCRPVGHRSEPQAPAQEEWAVRADTCAPYGILAGIEHPPRGA